MAYPKAKMLINYFVKIGRRIILFALIVFNSAAFGQATLTQNFIMTNTVKQSGVTNETSVNGLSISTQGKTQEISYLDGLGRPIQNIIVKGSASQKDIVTGIEYDFFGREVKKYLPYADQTSLTYGSFKDRWVTDQSSFYNGGLPNVEADNAPYSVAIMEASPLSLVLAQGAPGSTWQPTLSNPADPNAHVSKFQFLTNKSDDNIRIFNIDSLANITSSGYYVTGLINVKISIDEQQQTVKEFTDKSGHMILKRVMISGDSLQTYYIYDNLNLLRAIIQPEGTATLQAASWVFPVGFSSKWMFLYRYDYRNRLVMKKVPGADSVNTIYDQWDRVVLTQDGNLRVNHFWLFTKYDLHNRVVVTGQIYDIRTLSALQVDVNNSAGRFESVNTSATEGYTLNNSFPSSGSYTLTVYTTTHYDSYSNLPSWSSGYAFINEYSIPAQNSFLNGQVIATQVRVLGTNNFLRTITYYDDKYRNIQTITDNSAGGKDRVTNILTFDGKISNDYHNHTSRFFTTSFPKQQAYTYDHADRLLTVTHKTWTQEIVTIRQNTYNELGQLLNKKLHQSPSHPLPLQKLDYYYNIRGWLTGINRPLSAQAGYEEGDLFNLELHFQTITMPSAVIQFNGNIAEEVWKGGYDEYFRGYNFLYDKANRLTSSIYGYQYFNGFGPTWSLTKRYNEADISYDRNGNLLFMTRYHGDWNKINYLAYNNYSGNQLGRVQEWLGANPSNIGFKDKGNPSGNGNDYTYDSSGNLTSDYNKSITSIAYNFSNLPTLVSYNPQKTIAYTYDANGIKLQKTISDSGRITNYYYAGDFVYRSAATGSPDTLEFISQPEGRIRPVRVDTTQPISVSNLKYIYDYFLKDHLGSVRSVLTTEQQTDIYAATMETAAVAKEDALFKNVTATSVPKIAGMTNDNNNLRASKLGDVATAGNKRVGPSIVLKVMAGDTISIGTYGWYTGAVQPPPANAASLATELIPLLTAGVAGQGGGKGGAISSAFSDPLLGTDITNFLPTRNYIPTRPKAHLNWMVVDEEFAAVTSPNHMGAVQIPVCNAGDTMKQMIGPSNMVIRRNGWIYIYLSNESAQDVYFDNLVVNLTHGPLIEQKDYYAFGLEIPGLSTSALKYNYLPNKKKTFQGQEHNTDFGLDVLEFKYRMDDPEIGRFWQVDPLADQYTYNSTYDFSENKVTSHVELEGLEAEWYERQVQRDLDDIWSGRRTAEQIQQRVDERNGAGSFIFRKVLPQVGIAFLVVTQPEVGIPLALSDMTGIPVNPSPQALSSTVTSTAAAAGEEGVDLFITGKQNWSPSQNSQAYQKAEALTNAETTVTKTLPTRSANMRSGFVKVNPLKTGEHVDHTVELQLGGKDEFKNMNGLDGSVNTSFGSQIQHQIKNLPDGTKINKVIFTPFYYTQ
jgi:RHS repeat-associated protein